MAHRRYAWAFTAGCISVTVGGLGAAGGYLAASACSAWLVPALSWRILWFLNSPTGPILVALNPSIPESPKFLHAQGRWHEATAVLQRFGSGVHVVPARPSVSSPEPVTRWTSARRFIGTTCALSLAAVAWGLTKSGPLLRMPAHLIAKGYSMEVSSRLLAGSALIARPTAILAALPYSRWSSKGALRVSMAVTAPGLGGVIQLELAGSAAIGPAWSIALLIVGCNGIVATLLPFAAESDPLEFRGRATGWVAARTKGGGPIAQLISLLSLAPSLQVSAWAVLIPTLMSWVLVGRYCVETRRRDLRDLEVSPARS